MPLEKELDLLEIWRVLVKRWKLIILLPILAAAISAIISLFIITPQYEASTTMMVIRPADRAQIMVQDIQLNRQLVATYREIIHSRRVMEATIARQVLPLNVGELRNKVEVEAVRDTELFIVRVQDPDPVLARDIANEVARAFMEQITMIMQVENVSVVDTAVTPTSPVSPRVMLNIAVALVVGMMAAFGLAFLYEYLDRTIKDPDQAKQLLDIPVVGLVPKVEDQEQLFSTANPRAPASEAMRSIRTNIQFAGIDKPLTTLLVTGANPACGKSTITANLGVTLAQTGARVLIVDADLRKPTQHKLFNLWMEPGLTNLVLEPETSLKNVVQNSGYENLYVISSGTIPPYPAEMISSKRMKTVLEQLKDKFDYLVFDSPPVVAVTDAALLSGLSDGTLLVLDHGRVTREEALGAVEQLRQVQAKLVGIVLNNVPHQRSYYNGYQYYYGSSKEEKRSRRNKSKG